MKAFGGTYDQYLDTPEEAIEALLNIEAVYAEARPAPAPDYTPPMQGFPLIS